jgi:soluble lytic murein transglycosylase-like protein
MNWVSFLGAGCLLLSNVGTANAAERAAEPIIPVAESGSPWRRAAERHDVEVVDLYAIALQESRRRRPDGLLRPWPWTLHSPETGSLYFESYQGALDKLTELIAQGKTNIDVGVMQINWGWNGYRAGEPKRLLQPAENIEIAAQILREHLNEFGGDLRQAIARYHSPRADRGAPYAASVLAIRDHLLGAKAVQLALLE